MANNIDIVKIPSDRIDSVYPMVKKEISDSLKKAENGYGEEDVLSDLKEDLLSLWIVWDIDKKKHLGLIIAEISKRPQFKVFSIFMVLGKDREKWQFKAQKVLEDFAIYNDCYKCFHPARKGWSKIFKQHGYKETHVLLEKTLNKQQER
jgi:hypothetical protein